MRWDLSVITISRYRLVVRFRVRIELHGIAHDVEIGAPDRRALPRTQNPRFQIEHRSAHVDLEIGTTLRRVGRDLEMLERTCPSSIRRAVPASNFPADDPRRRNRAGPGLWLRDRREVEYWSNFARPEKHSVWRWRACFSCRLLIWPRQTPSRSTATRLTIAKRTAPVFGAAATRRQHE